MTAIRKHLRDFFAIIGLVLISGLVAVYVLHNQRVRFPFVESAPFTLKADFSTAQAVTPGQGQTIRVSGVRIGDITGTELHDGVATVTFDIDSKYKNLIHTDATALLRPKTGLKDMFVALNPGSNSAPVAKPGWTIPVNNTLPDINPDEVYALLDSDTRDYLKLLINGAGEGLHGRGHDLQDVFRRFEPTHRDLARVTSAVAVRHANLKRLITNLNVLNKALAGSSTQLTDLVGTSAKVFRAFASEDTNISRAVTDLPGALRQTTATLNKVTPYANVLSAASDALTPVAPSLDKANHATIPFARASSPIVRDKIRPFVRVAQPLVRMLTAPAHKLAKATPDLTGTFTVLNHLFNMVGYNPKGTEGPSVPGRDEGFLYWLAWLDHDGAALFSSSDANGPFRPVTFDTTCQTLQSVLSEEGANPVYQLVFGQPLFDSAVCKSGIR